jgi:hypothetical protein
VVDSRVGVLIVDPVRLRVLRRLTGPAYRFAPDVEPWDLAWTSRSSLVVLGFCECGALAYLDINLPGRFGSPGGISSETDTWAREETWEHTRKGFAVLVRGEGLLVLDLMDDWSLNHVTLEGLPPPSRRQTALAVDSAGDRVFVVSRAGKVAEVGRIGTRRPTVSYHEVQLAPPTGEWSMTGAAWLGSGTLAVWASDGGGTPPSPAGLTFVDTRSWRARVVDPAISHAAAARGWVVGWTASARDGVAVYGRGGFERLRALAGREIRWVDALARYAYAWADCSAPTGLESCSRFSVDLGTGRVTGPLRSRARPLIRPDAGQ